jgi:hypothetical protein
MSENTTKERVYLNAQEAIDMLADGPMIHTFRQAGYMLIGADMKRKKVVEKIKKYKPELSGEVASRMKHGIVLSDDKGVLFIRTKGE